MWDSRVQNSSQEGRSEVRACPGVGDWRSEGVDGAGMGGEEAMEVTVPAWGDHIQALGPQQRVFLASCILGTMSVQGPVA